MDIEIDNIPLIKRVEDPQTRVVKEIRNVHNITTSNRRKVIEHKITCSEGSILSDLGRLPVRISFDGEFQGPDAKASLENLRAKFKVGKPLSFSSDITNIADINQVLIEEFHIDEIGGRLNQYSYSIVLREYRPPPPQAQPPPSQEEQAQDEVKKESEIDDIRGQILDADGNPAKGITTRIKGAGGEWQVKTDDQGYYEVLDVPEGKYEITVDAEGYEDVKAEVEIKKGGRT
jgi:hypothetical protein